MDIPQGGRVELLRNVFVPTGSHIDLTPMFQCLRLLGAHRGNTLWTSQSLCDLTGVPLSSPPRPRAVRTDDLGFQADATSGQELALALQPPCLSY